MRIVETAKVLKFTGKYDRPEKNEARNLIFQDIGPKTSIITLPSDAALCSQAMLRHGLITKATHQHWVEMSGAISSRLPIVAEELGFKNVVVKKTLLEDFIPTRKIDLVNADMESSFTERLGLAFEENLSPWFKDDTTIVLWLTAWARNPATKDFHDWVDRKVQQSGVLRDCADLIAGEKNTQDRSVVLPMVMMACALNRFRLNFSSSKPYADTRSGMVVFKINNIYWQDGPPALPSFSSLVEEFRSDYHREYLMTGHQRDLLARLQAHFAPEGQSVSFQDDRWWVIDSRGGRLMSTDQIEHLYEVHRRFMS